MSKITKLYLDLDGLFADFDGRVQELCGSHPRDIPKKELWKIVHRDPRFFANLKLMPGSWALWEEAKRYKPVFLTGAPSSEAFREQKKEWVAATFGPEWEVIVLPRRDKPNYSLPGHVLIDDSHDNITAWETKGGLGIHHDGDMMGTQVKLMQAHIFGYLGELDRDMLETMLAATLQSEIWKEITATTGETREMLDAKIIDQMKELVRDAKNVAHAAELVTQKEAT